MKKSKEKPQVVTKWVPTLKQRALIDALSDYSQNGTITAACLAAGVSRTEYYRDMVIPEFENLLNDTLDRVARAHIREVDNALINKATTGGEDRDGETGAMRLFYERTGKIKGDREANQPITLNISGIPRPGETKKK